MFVYTKVNLSIGLIAGYKHFVWVVVELYRLVCGVLGWQNCYLAHTLNHQHI